MLNMKYPLTMKTKQPQFSFMLTGCFEISTGGGWGREVWSELGWQMMIFTHVVLFSEILITGN